MQMVDKDIINPIWFLQNGWPQYRLATHQWQILMSLYEAPVPYGETIVPAGNGLGKDFIAGFAALWWFCSRRPARVVTTSVKGDQLEDVLWGEIRRFIYQSKLKLPIQYNHQLIRQLNSDGTLYTEFPCEMVGQVIRKGESLLGRHSFKDIPRTLVVYDEASGIDTEVYTSARTWAHHCLIIGNPFPCENFFKNLVKEGEIRNPDGTYRRRIIHVRAEDSPNVQYGFHQILKGERKPEPLLIKTDQQYWGIYSQAEYDMLLKRWEAQQEAA